MTDEVRKASVKVGVIGDFLVAAQCVLEEVRDQNVPRITDKKHHLLALVNGFIRVDDGKWLPVGIVVMAEKKGRKFWGIL